MIVIFEINLSILGRSSFLTWTGLLVVFSAKTFVSLPLLLRPTCFAKKLSHWVVSWICELVCKSNAKPKLSA